MYFPELELCTDNGAMIAFAGALRLQAGGTPTTGIGTAIDGFRVRPRWPLDTLPAL